MFVNCCFSSVCNKLTDIEICFAERDRKKFRVNTPASFIPRHLDFRLILFCLKHGIENTQSRSRKIESSLVIQRGRDLYKALLDGETDIAIWDMMEVRLE